MPSLATLPPTQIKDAATKYSPIASAIMSSRTRLNHSKLNKTNSEPKIKVSHSLLPHPTEISENSAKIAPSSNANKKSSSGSVSNRSHFDDFSSSQTVHLDKSCITPNYQLSRMSTSVSVDSKNFDFEQRYRIKLSLTRKEIELLRYTWNQMITDQPVSQFDANVTNIPGAFKQMAPSRSGLAVSASSMFCRQFYANLLSMDPNLEKLFPSINHQSVAFAGVISLAVSQLENLLGVEDYLSNLGKRHSRILGIEPAQFELLGEAFILTFHERLGAKFEPQLEILWIKLYMYLANTLLQYGIDPVAKVTSGSPDYDQYSVTSKQSATSNQDVDIDSVSMGGSSLMEEQSTTSTNDTSIDAGSFVPEKKASNYKAKIKRKGSDCVIM
jgi:hemoglobin-like flavoprotein